jgi:hypothetical protein
MKFNNIIKEEKSGKVVTLTNIERKLLSILQKKNVSPTNMKDIINFLSETLHIEDEELALRLIKLYWFNYHDVVEVGAGDFKDLKKGKIESDYIEENYDVIALSEALRVDPFLISQVYEGITDDPDYLYLPEYRIWALPMPGETLRYAEEYAVAEGYQQAYDATHTKLSETLEEEGPGHFAGSFLERYVTPTYGWIDSEAHQRADDDWAEVGDDENMREEIGETAEYNSIKDEIDITKSEILNILRKIQESEFKRDELEKEKIILETEIERLGGVIEYDDETPDYSEFSSEIERLQYKLNSIEGVFEEVKTVIEILYKENDGAQHEISNLKEELSKYEGAPLEALYREYRYEFWSDEMEDDPLEYLATYWDMSISDAIADGYASLNEEEFMDAAIEGDGFAHYLATYDGSQREIKVGDESYFIFRIN